MPRPMKPCRIASIFAVALTALLAAACGRLNMDNYSRLKVGQSYDEVVAVIGQPARCDELLGVRQCVWGDDNRNIKIGFVAGSALTLSAHNLK